MTILTRARTFERLALTDGQIDSASRTISFTFATSNVARDGHRILPGAWQSKGYDGLANFRKSPVFLWSHHTDIPPIGRVTAISERDGKLAGTVLFADNDDADKIFRLFKGGFLYATSVSWLPVDWSYASGTGRGAGAIDFKRVELLEISAVAVPADPDAIAVARALGLPVAKAGVQAARSGARLSKADAAALEKVHDHARRTGQLCKSVCDTFGAGNLKDQKTREALAGLMAAAHGHAEQTRAMIRDHIDTCQGSAPESPDATGDAAVEERCAKLRLDPGPEGRAFRQREAHAKARLLKSRELCERLAPLIAAEEREERVRELKARLIKLCGS